MPKFTMTLLDITSSVLPVLEAHREATKLEAENNKTADVPLYNARAQAFRAVKAKIEEVCPVYVREEDDFFNEVKATHAHTKELFQRSEARLKLARKACTPELLRDSQEDLAAAKLQVSDLDELFLERVKHQGFRGGICEAKLATPVIGVAGFKDLNALYLEYRGPAVNRTPKIREARVKIGQHVERVSAIHEEIQLLARGGKATPVDVAGTVTKLTLDANKVFNDVENGEGMNSSIDSVQGRVDGDVTYLTTDVPAFFASATSKVEKERTNYAKFKDERIAALKMKKTAIEQYNLQATGFASQIKTLGTYLDVATKVAKQSPKSVEAKALAADLKKKHDTLTKKLAKLTKAVAKVEKAYPPALKLAAKAK